MPVQVLGVGKVIANFFFFNKKKLIGTKSFFESGVSVEPGLLN